MKNKNWNQNAYKNTSVYWGKSQSQIMVMLEKIGIKQVRFTSMEDRFVLEFVAQFDDRQVPKGVRIVTPIRVTKNDNPEKRNKELNYIHRVLLNHLKAKFIAVQSGIAEFEHEFMAHLIITDKQGRTSTLGEAVLPQYEKNLKDGTMPNFLLGDGK
jgi:hypothetical protein